MTRRSKMESARSILETKIAAAKPDEWVTSVADLGQEAGLTTGPTVRVLQEAIADGWLRSTRGPDGGYWRTDQPVLQISGPHAGISPGLQDALRRAQEALTEARRLANEFSPPRPPLQQMTATHTVADFDDAHAAHAGLVDIDIPRQTCEVSAIAEFADRADEPPVRFESEREFLTANPDRRNPHFVLHALYDGSLDTAEWALKHCPHTHEVYAYRTTPPIPSEAHIILDDAGHNRMHPDYAGDPDGPCWRLGTIYNDRLLHGLVDNTSLMRRAGGIVWVYGRLRALDTAIHELVMSDGTLAELGENLADYDEARR